MFWNSTGHKRIDKFKLSFVNNSYIYISYGNHPLIVIHYREYPHEVQIIYNNDDIKITGVDII